jgi:hypothetical protein
MAYPHATLLYSPKRLIWTGRTNCRLKGNKLQRSAPALALFCRMQASHGAWHGNLGCPRCSTSALPLHQSPAIRVFAPCSACSSKQDSLRPLTGSSTLSWNELLKQFFIHKFWGRQVVHHIQLKTHFGRFSLSIRKDFAKKQTLQKNGWPCSVF